MFFYFFVFEKMDINPYKQQMQKAIEYLESTFQGFQMGRASSSMLDNININASYGQVKINAIWHVSVMDPHTIKVECWDKKELKNVEKAIYDAELGLAPKNEWEYILVSIPPLTKDRREELSKKIKSVWEETKAQIRRIRQDAMQETKILLKDKEISEDQNKSNETDIDNLVKDSSLKIDSLVKLKSEEVMSV